MFCGGG
ncbi:hypothetical protein YPPY06_2652, partial [Yersinia pestis PY-06]